MKKPLMLICLFSLSLCCSSQKAEWQGDIKYEDGIKIIHNKSPLWGDEPEVKLGFGHKLGKLYSDDENYMFNKPWDLAEDSEENIYIVDLGDSCVKKFSPKGEYLKTFGRNGQGPGEFGQCRYIEIDKDDTIYIRDLMFDRIQVFNTDGEFSNTIPDIRFGKFRIIDSNKFLVRGYNYNTSMPKSTTMTITSFKNEVLNEFSKSTIYTLADKEKEMYVSSGGNSLVFTSDKEDNIYLAYKSLNRIEKYDKSCKLLYKTDRTLNFKIGYEMKTEFSDIERTIKVALPKFRHVSRAIQIDHKNRIWVLAHKSHADDYDKVLANDIYELEVYSNDGILLGKLTYPVEWEAGFTPEMKIFGNRVYFLNALTSPEIYQYKIIDK